MKKKPYLIFDAGGVLVFPDFNRLTEIARQVGISTTRDKIMEGHAKLFRAVDEYAAQNHHLPNINYFLDIFKQVTESEERAEAAKLLTQAFDKEKHIWTSSRPWVKNAIKKLKQQGYYMAVVSNSDGRVDQILQELGLRQYFEAVIDSFVVGVEKPDPRIFEIALNQLNWDSRDTIYIGDIFYIDVWGANHAGLGAIHMDLNGLYDNWAGVRIPSIHELPELLSSINGKLREWDLYPFKEIEIR
jgi:HAD superfamily hydrolase (TIGR01662 family)